MYTRNRKSSSTNLKWHASNNHDLWLDCVFRNINIQEIVPERWHADTRSGRRVTTTSELAFSSSIVYCACWKVDWFFIFCDRFSFLYILFWLTQLLNLYNNNNLNYFIRRIINNNNDIYLSLLWDNREGVLSEQGETSSGIPSFGGPYQPWLHLQLSCRYSPAVVVMDLHKKGVFNMPGEFDKLLFHIF